MSVNENVLSAAAPVYEVTERGVRFTHFPVLDGLRGIAVLLVMACHLEFVIPQLHPLVKGGFLGVDVFFVLSGFLITSILLREQDKNGKISLKNFYLRRFLRLTPAFWTFLASLYFLGNYILPRDQAKIIYEGNDFLYSLLYVINWDRALGAAAIGNLNHTWSLAIEEQFYIVWSVSLWFAFSRRLTRQNLVSFLGIFILVLVLWRAFRWTTGADLETLYYATDARIDGLLIGCLASMLYCWRLLSNEFFASRKFGFLALVSLIIALTILFSFSHQDVLLYLGMTSVFSLAIAVVILRLIATRNTLFHKLLENRGLRWVGCISYALYLWHYASFEFARKLLASPAMQSLLGVTMAFAVATLSYFLIERPFLALKDRLASQEPQNT